MTKITLKQLRYFQALAQTGHFGRAADLSAISQPALSMQIKELEESLGTILFERGPRQVRMTSFGEELASRAGDILKSVDELADLARASKDKLVGRLRIGVIPTIAPYLLPKIIGSLTDLHPGLDIHVRETMTPKLLQELGDGRLDLAMLALPIAEKRFVEVPLFDECFLLVRPSKDSGTSPPSIDALRDMRLLLLEEGHCFRDQTLSFCQFNAAVPRDGLDGSSLSTLVQMVAAGLGVTFLPQMAISVETRSTPVHVSPLHGAQPSRTVGMIWRKSSPLARQFGDIADLVRTIAKTDLSAHNSR